MNGKTVGEDGETQGWGGAEKRRKRGEKWKSMSVDRKKECEWIGKRLIQAVLTKGRKEKDEVNYEEGGGGMKGRGKSAGEERK